MRLRISSLQRRRQKLWFYLFDTMVCYIKFHVLKGCFLCFQFFFLYTGLWYLRVKICRICRSPRERSPNLVFLLTEWLCTNYLTYVWVSASLSVKSAMWEIVGYWIRFLFPFPLNRWGTEGLSGWYQLKVRNFKTGQAIHINFSLCVCYSLFFHYLQETVHLGGWQE